MRQVFVEALWAGQLPKRKPTVVAAECLKWVKGVAREVGQLLPAYPGKRTISEPARTSHSGHQRKSNRTR